MPALRDLVRDALRALRSPRRAPPPRGEPSPGELNPGRDGPFATTQAVTVGQVVTSYNPSTDGDPDPGEIVWTWVPFEENDGRGKDRPVLVVAREPGGTVLAVQLSSQDHRGDAEWVPVGSGGWDADRRASWVDVSRVLRVHPQGMRREAAALRRDRFDPVIDALRARYGWT